MKIHVMYCGSLWPLLRKTEKILRPITRHAALGAFLPIAEPAATVAGTFMNEYIDTFDRVIDVHSLKGLTPEGIKKYPLDDRVKDFIIGHNQNGTPMPKGKHMAEILAAASITYLIVGMGVPAGALPLLGGWGIGGLYNILKN